MNSFLKRLVFAFCFLYFASIPSHFIFAEVTSSDIKSAVGALQDTLTGLDEYKNGTQQQKSLADALITNFQTSATAKLSTTNASTQPSGFLQGVLKSELDKLDAVKNGSTVPQDTKTFVRLIQDTAQLLSNAEFDTGPGAATYTGDGAGLGNNAPQPSATQKTPNSEEDVTGCNPFSFDFGKCVTGAVGWIMRFIFVRLAIGLFYLCGTVLDVTIYFGLVSMKSLITEDVYTLWLFTRNLVLAASLFSILYFVGMYLLGLGQSIQRAAAAVILFAIFSGFSFSISTYLIDGSNLVTSSLYNSIDTNWSKGDSFTNPIIAKRFMDSLGMSGASQVLTGTVSTNSLLGQASAGSGFAGVFTAIGLNLLVAITLVYDSFVLLMMGIIFLFRDLGLFVGVIFSPLLLIDKAIPRLSEWADKLRKFFFGQLAIGPVFMFLMYVALKVTEVIQKGTRGLSGGNTTVSAPLILFNIFAITAIFYFTYKICKSLSGVLGEAVLGAVGGLASKAMIATPLGAAGRVAAFAGQNTVGRAARHLTREGGGLEKWKDGGGYFAGAAFKAANYAGNTATYDISNSKFVANARSTFDQKTGANTSKSFVGGALGYEATREKVREQTIKEVSTVGTEEGRQNVINRRVRGFKAGTTLMLPTENEKRQLDKFRDQITDAGVKKAKSSFNDKITELGLDDLEMKDEKGKKRILEDLKRIYNDSQKGSKEVRDYSKDLLKKRLLELITKQVKESKDAKLDPLSINFEDNATKAFEEIAKGFDKDIGLSGADSLADNAKLLENFEVQMGLYATAKRKEKNDVLERTAQRNSTKKEANDVTLPPTFQPETIYKGGFDIGGEDLGADIFTLVPKTPSGPASAGITPPSPLPTEAKNEPAKAPAEGKAPVKEPQAA